MSKTNPLSAGVYENIIDDTFVVDGNTQNAAGGIIVSAKRGPTKPTVVTSNTQLVSLYGLPSRDNPALYSAMRFLREASELVVTRVIVDAVAATGDLVKGVDTHLTVDAANEGVWGNKVTVSFAAVVGAAAGVFALVVKEDGVEVERFEVSRDVDAKDGYGKTLFVEDVVNKKSKYVKVTDNPAVVGDYDIAGVVTLAGGLDDTTAPTDGVINTAWDEYAKEDEINVQILINGGWATAAVQQKMVDIASARTNCRAILDVPSDTNEDVAAMIAWRDTIGIDDYHAALYGGWIKIYDQFGDREVMLPPSGDVAAAFARTFRDFNHWDAPAGMRRGVVNALGVTKIFTEAERDLLYTNGVNPVTTYAGTSAVIWGQKSLQRAKSAMDRMNVVNNVMWMTATMKESLRPFVFEGSTQFVRDNVNYLLTTFLEGVKGRGGLYGFSVDTESSNTAEVIDSNRFIINVFVQPTRSSEMIMLNLTVSPTGVELG